MEYKRAARIAQTLGCIERCAAKPQPDGTPHLWLGKHEETLRTLMENAPSGSGFDNGTELSGKSTEEKLVFETAFHHMNEHGYYTGWSHHEVTIKPSLAFGFTLRVSGRNHRDIKDYIGEVFHDWLNEEVTQ